MSWILHILEVVAILLVLLSLSMGMIWLERRLLGGFQDRYGPNRVGPAGPLQPVADAIKLFTKEDWVPPFADPYMFIVAPCIVAVTVLLAFGVVPFTSTIHVADLNIGLLFFLAMASLGVYSIVLAGWGSNSKYSLIGAASLSALPLVTAGFYSKDAILGASWAGPCGSPALWGAGILAACLTGLYVFRAFFIAFLGPTGKPVTRRPGFTGPPAAAGQPRGGCALPVRGGRGLRRHAAGARRL